MMRHSLGVIRVLASIAMAGLIALMGAGALAAAPALSPIPHDRVISGLSVQMAGDVPASASAQAPYAVMVEAISTLRAVNNVSVSVAVTDAPLADVEALTAFVASPSDTAAHMLATTPVADGTPGGGQLRVGARTKTAIIVPPGGLGISADAPGVYGVVVSLAVDGETVWTRASPVTWQPSLLPKLAITAVASITGAPSRVDALLAAAADRRVTLLVDPTALTSKQRLSLSDREAYALPAANIDVTSAAHTKTPALIEAAVSRTRAVSSLRWVAVAAAADASTVSTATKEGAAAVLIDARWATIDAPPGGGAYDAGMVDDVASSPVIVANGPLSTMLATRSPADSTTTAWVLAQAAFEASAGVGSVVVAPGDAWGVEGTGASRALAALLDAPFVTSRTLEELLSAPERPALELPEETLKPSDGAAEDVVGAVSALSFLDDLAKATTTPSAMIASAERAVLESMSLANRADPAFRAEQAVAARESAATVMGAVAVTSGSQLLLVSSSGSVPITVSNMLDVPVTVRLAVTSQSPILRTKQQPTVTIDAGTDATVKVPV
ncbi:MAG: hypothetical protein HGA51_07740, partial [Demequinaceae bacterium]|nr:hypothetical protein [Demequinaceae bacterium]